MNRLTLDPNSDIFLKLKDGPIWWKNLKTAADVYVDIRKNSINAYYKGGSIIKLNYENNKGFSGEIAFEYIPTEQTLKPDGKNRIPYHFDNNHEVEFTAADIQIAKIKQFSREWLGKIKKRIDLFNPRGSEKAIQGDYVVNNSYFIDSEIMPVKGSRIDLVWLAVEEKRIYFVELKTIGDPRLFGAEETPESENINSQLNKYSDFISKHNRKLIEYYANLIKIKHSLRILPKGYDGPFDCLTGYEVQPKPILLIGDCTKEWIVANSEQILEKVRRHAYAVVYHGRNTKTFTVPKKNHKNKHYIC